MGVIIARMPRKRQKSSFIDRLLELGIIHDKKQCRKKRQKKSGAKTTGSEDDGGKSNDSSNSESDKSDSDSDSRSPIRIKPAKKLHQKKDANKIKKKKSIELSANEIAKLLVQAVDNGYTEALKWLAENLEEVALDQEAEGFDPSADGTPLVPIGSDAVEAMESELFRKLLVGVGVAPPGDEQEMYWRIPSSLHFDTIRKRREIIMKAVHKELIIDTNEPSENSPQNEQRNDESSDDDDDLFDNLRKMRENTSETDANSVLNQAENNTDIRKSALISKPRNKRSRSIDSDDMDSREKMQKIDEDDENSNKDDDDILSFAKKTLQQEELPDTEDILSNIPRGDSDDSDNEEIVLPAKRDKKRRIVIDDDSD